MPTIEISLCLSVVAGAVALFVTEKLRVDVTALCVLAALVVLGLVTADQVLYGFANPATATVAAMFVISTGLVRTGLVQWLVHRIDAVAGNTEWRLMVVLCLTVAILSAFVVNTATVSILIPVAIVLSRKRRISSSRVLIPLSFASQFGGVCTLIGTSTNILVSSIAVSSGIAAFGLFEFAPLGLIMSGAGILYLVFVARRFLPRREGQVQRVDKYRLAEYLGEFQIKKDSPLIGRQWGDLRVGKDEDVALIKLLREDKATWRPARTKMKESDVLLIFGQADTLLAVKDQYGLDMQANVTIKDEQLSSDEVELVEALVPPRSSLIGRTLKSSNFVRRFGCEVLAMQRRGKTLRDRLVGITIEAGDTLLLQGDKTDTERLLRSSDLIVTNELTDLYLRKDRAVRALVLLTGVILLSALKILPIVSAALIGATGMVVSGCLTIEEAYRAIDWKVIFLLGGILPLGLALEQTGTAQWLVTGLSGVMFETAPLAALAVLYLITALLTEAMSNNAAAVLLAPFALSMAAAMNVSPRPFLVAITFAASTSFATPVGYQTNTMVYAPGGYRFSDFVRVGAPLNLLFWALAVLFIPRLWPF
jgi:di/tricarboxylate transporter